MDVIVLGSGLSQFVNQIETSSSINYNSIFSFDIAPLHGHQRKIYFGQIGDKPIVVLSGKLHRYEGFSLSQIFAPLKYILERHTIKSITLTGVSGGLSRNIKTGNWYQIAGFLELPLSFYKPNSNKIDINKSKEPQIFQYDLASANYAFQEGPSLGTPSEYKMLNYFGADLIGMSLLPAFKALKQTNIPIAFLSLPVCNYFPFINVTEPSHEDVVTLAQAGAKELFSIFKYKLSNNV